MTKRVSQRIRAAGLLAAAILLGPLCCAAAESTVSPEEMKLKNDWVSQNVSVPAPEAAWPAGLFVLANHDGVDRNAARYGRPLILGDKEYRRGLFCHANSRILIQLPSPGKAFSATAGIDSNPDTKPGRGSVVFSVKVTDNEAFKSAVMREGMPGVPVSADLGGATRFILEVGDAGDGISCDQADWVDAKVTLADGQELWLGDMPFTAPKQFPFSFMYGNTPSAQLLVDCPLKSSSRALDKNRTEQTLTWTEPKTGLEVRMVSVNYSDFPTVEWTLWFKNTGSQETPALSNIQALDIGLTRPRDRGYLLHTIRGSQCAQNDFEALIQELGPRSKSDFGTSGGRSTNGGWPYWNIAWGDAGVIAVLGWPGQWDASMLRDDDVGLKVRAGLSPFNSTLKPGEEIRSPLALLQFWQGGDWIRAQNMWRHFYVDHVIPHPNGKLPKPFTATCIDDAFPGMLSNAEAEMRGMDDYIQRGHKFDRWWIDAGWYDTDKDWAAGVGSWNPHPKRYPKGIREVSDYAHKLGMELVLWFEPERVAPDTWLYKNHPEWLLGTDGQMKLLNLGHPDGFKWLTGFINTFITEQGVDLYRQDFNIDPLGIWEQSDVPNRKGMTEMKYIMGFLAYWDDLLRNHPGMLIDTCASGGRRLDIETLRRSVPLLRTDYRTEPHGCQAQMYGLSLWVNYHGSGVGIDSKYIARTHMNANFAYGIDRKNGDWELMKQMDKEWREICDNYVVGDFYPLTTYSLAGDVWMAWQFDQAEAGEGVVQVFRRKDSPVDTMTFKLHGLNPSTTYELKNFDVAGTTQVSGKDLMDKGVTLKLDNKPDSATIKYQKVK